MKPTAVLFTVILLVTGILLIGVSCNTKGTPKTYIPDDNVLLEIPVKEEKAAPAPQPDFKEADSPKVAKVKYIAPKVYTIEVKRDSISCGTIMPPPVPEEDYIDSIVFTKVEIEAEYPGGAAAWQRYLNRNLRYPQELIDNEIQSSAVVQFVVDKEGIVSNVEGVSGPEALCAEAVRVIKKSGKWVPAVQGGQQVRSLKKQPFIICLRSEE
jgi:periplasmic protein TonB